MNARELAENLIDDDQDAFLSARDTFIKLFPLDSDIFDETFEEITGWKWGKYVKTFGD